MRLTNRVEALERRNPQWKPWHQIIVRPGETVEDMKKAYEAKNGPVGDDHWLIIRIGRATERDRHLVE